MERLASHAQVPRLQSSSMYANLPLPKSLRQILLKNLIILLNLQLQMAVSFSVSP